MFESDPIFPSEIFYPTTSSSKTRTLKTKDCHIEDPYLQDTYTQDMNTQDANTEDQRSRLQTSTHSISTTFYQPMCNYFDQRSTSTRRRRDIPVIIS